MLYCISSYHGTMIRLTKPAGKRLRVVRCGAAAARWPSCVRVAASSKPVNDVINNGWMHSPIKLMSTVTSTHHSSFSFASEVLVKATFSSSAAPKLDLQSPHSHISLLADDTSHAQKSKKKRQQKKKKSQLDSNAVSVPKQSSYTTRILFDLITPHIEFRTLHQLTKQLSRMITRGHRKLDASDVNVKKRTIKRRLRMLFEPESKSSATSEEYSWSIKGHRWIQPLIYQYIMGKHLDATAQKKRKTNTPNQSSGSHKHDQTYPPNQNRKNYETNITTLMKARQVSLQHPIFWTEKLMRESGYSFSKNAQRDPQRLQYQQEISRLHSLKDEEQLHDDAEHLLQVLMDYLPPPHFNKLMRSLEDYTKLDDDNVTEKSSGNSWCIDDDNDENLSSQSARNSSVKGRRIPVLGKFLGESSSSHSHLVAVELGRFLYVKLPSPGKGGSEKLADNYGTDDSSEETEVTELEAAYALEKHRKLHSTEKRYQKMKDDFVTKMMELQHKFAAWDEESEGKSSASNNSGSSDMDTDDSDTDDSTDLQVNEFEKEQLKYNTDTRKIQKEELAETLAELRRMGLRTEEDGIATKGRGRPRKGIHLKFTAVRMEDNKSDEDSSVSTHSSSTASELEQRIVFLNNLPIDTTEEEIDQIYSRCGSLDSIQLFNLRPDLDPGPLTKAQLAERQRNSRLKNKYSNEPKFQQQRPRTPVYGMLTFKDAEGFITATCPELSIFGCVIRRHPVMSIKPQDVKTLYLENIPASLYSMDVEYKLARCLHPHQVYVMLDGMKGVGKDAQKGTNQEYSEPASCEVKFEDFQTAMQAYNWIRAGAEGGVGEGSNVTLMGGEDCQLHWFRTPPEAMKYWTRELNF